MTITTASVQKYLVLYIILWTVSPPLQLDMIFRYAALASVGLWFVLNVLYKMQCEKIHIFALLFLLMIVTVAWVQGNGSISALLQPIGLYLMIICFLMVYFYDGRWGELSGLIPIVLICLAYFNYQSFQTVLQTPEVARLIVRNDPEIYKYMRMGVGGYGLLYAQTSVFPVLLQWTIGAFKKSKLKFAIGVVWLITYMLYLFNSGYTIATVTTVAALILLFFYRQRSVVLAVLVTFVLMVLLVWLIGYNDGVRNGLLNVFDGTTVAKKIDDIHQSVTTTDTADSILVRIEAYNDSLSAIINYPLIGGLWIAGGGGHSALLDAFAKYGIFGGVMNIKILFDFVLGIKRNSSDPRDIRLANATLVSVLMVTLLNSMPYNLIGMILFMVPMCYHDIVKWREPYENSLDGEPDPQGSLPCPEC